MIGLSYWEDNSIEILKNDSAESIFKGKTGYEASARSLVFIQFEQTLYLMAGLRNGYLVYYDMTTYERVSLRIGCQAVVLEKFKYKDRELVFTASDNCIILYNDRKKIMYASLNKGKASLASGFHTESFPDCIAIATGKTFSIISFEELQKYSLMSEKKELTLISMQSFHEFTIVSACDIGKKYYLKLYDLDLHEVYSIQFRDFEVITSFVVLNSKIFVAFILLDSVTLEEISGIIKIFIIEDNKFLLIDEPPFPDKPVYSIAAVNNEIVAAIGQDLHYMKIIQNSLESLYVFIKRDCIRAMDVLNTRVAVIGIRNYLSVFEANGKKLINVCNFYKFDFACAVKIISSEFIAVGDLNSNIFLFQVEQHRIVPCSGFFLEKHSINCIKSFRVFQENLNFERNGLVYGTPYGEIGVIIQLSIEEYQLLKALQKTITKEIDCFKFIENLHKPIIRGKFLNIDEFIDGSIVEKYLDLTSEKQKEIGNELRKALNNTFDEEFLNNLLQKMSQLH